MGIKGLNAFLRKECPNAFIELPNTYFYGKRIAIDSDNLLHRFMSRAHKEIVDKTDVSIMEPDRDEIIKKWIYHVKNYTFDLLRVGATPIFVFDGKYIDEKSETQKKRKADKKKMIDAAEDMKMKIMEIDELERTPDMITALRKKMHNLGFLSSDEKEIMINIFTAIGIPVLKATGEGEQLCAMLCIEGKVDAVYSRDSDLTAFGCPLTISEPAGYIYNPKTHRVEESLKCTIFRPILSSLNMSYDMFKDLCIMSGCDFNNNMPHIGIKKSRDILHGCGSIEKIPAKYHVRSKCKRNDHVVCRNIYDNYEDQTKCLNYVRCREIMGHYPSETICQDELVINIDNNLIDARDRLEMYGADDWLNDVIVLYKNLPTPSNLFVPKPPTLNRSTLRLNIGNHTNNSQPKLVIVGGNNNNLSEIEQLARTQQKSSPKQITTKRANKLSQNQHKRLFEKYPHLRAKAGLIDPQIQVTQINNQNQHNNQPPVQSQSNQVPIIIPTFYQ